MLPIDALIAAHPNDGDEAPFWAGRASVVGYETLQPWLTGSWAKQRARSEATLRALYATDHATVLDYCTTHHVTHLLLNDDRYGADFRQRAKLFEPFDTMLRGLLARVTAADLVLAELPSDTVVARAGRFRIVDVAKLSAAWSARP